jgi:bifunctional UDP-N-acetylglucosamine pyrophosphorylase/glucosamine-1-phosphate N-acetyltransferase
MNLSIIILAAGQGTRMRSDLPKVLHPLGGRPMLAHVLDTARSLDHATLHVVIGHGAHHVREIFPDAGVNWVMQDRQLGTGHAVAQVMPAIPDGDTVLVMYGDVPLISRDTLEPLCHVAAQGFVGVLTAEPGDPAGYGRILHHADGSISGIVEEKDATAAALSRKRMRLPHSGRYTKSIPGFLLHLPRSCAAGWSRWITTMHRASFTSPT